jgi:hypothetical protein
MKINLLKINFLLDVSHNYYADLIVNYFYIIMLYFKLNIKGEVFNFCECLNKLKSLFVFEAFKFLYITL